MVVVRGIAAVDDDPELRPVFVLLLGESVLASVLAPLVLVPLLLFLGVLERTPPDIAVAGTTMAASPWVFGFACVGVGVAHGLAFGVAEWLVGRQRPRLALLVALVAPFLWIFASIFVGSLVESTDSLAAFNATLRIANDSDFWILGLFLSFLAVWIHGPLLVCRQRHGDVIEQCGASGIGALLPMPLLALAFMAPVEIDRGISITTIVLFVFGASFPVFLALARRPVYACLRVIEQHWEPVDRSGGTFTRLRRLWSLDEVADGALLVLVVGALCVWVRGFRYGFRAEVIDPEIVLVTLAVHVFLQVRSSAVAVEHRGWPRATRVAWFALTFASVFAFFTERDPREFPFWRTGVVVAVVVVLCAFKVLRGNHGLGAWLLLPRE